MPQSPISHADLLPADRSPAPSLPPGALAVVQFTSGTTSDRAADCSPTALMAAVRAIVGAPLHGADVFLPWVPY